MHIELGALLCDSSLISELPCMNMPKKGKYVNYEHIKERKNVRIRKFKLSQLELNQKRQKKIKRADHEPLATSKECWIAMFIQLKRGP